MRSTLKSVSVAVLILTVIVTVLCASALVDQEGKSATAVQAAAKANVLDAVGDLQFRQAERDEATANAAAAIDGAALAASVVIFLLAAIVWLLADGARNQEATPAAGNNAVPTV
jgi:uncharacterized membrane protein YeiB